MTKKSGTASKRNLFAVAPGKSAPAENTAQLEQVSENGNAWNGKPEPGHAPQLLINKQSAVPLHVQLKEQVRYAIMSGFYEAGSPLPSIRELTAQLGIHRNTVHRVYLELQATGLLVSRPGKGVFVSESFSETISAKEINAIEELTDRFFVDANAIGVNPITLAGLLNQRAPAFDSRHPTVGFVECTAHQSSEFARGLADQFGVSVQQILLDDLRNATEVASSTLKHLVTSLFHYDEVRETVAEFDIRVHPVTYDLHPATRKLLRELPPDCRLGFVCQDANTEEVMGAEITERVPAGVLLGCANLESPQLALDLISKVNTVILTEAASAFCIEHCSPKHELLELHFALNPPSVEKVGKIITYRP